jgi:Uma2 family endonuclease
MSRPAQALPPVPAPEDFDQRVILHGVTWKQYETILAIRGDAAGVRIAYLAGELELMSPSRGHERTKTLIARLLEAYAEERGLEFDGYGSLTMRSAPRKRGAEPDECYEVGGGPKKFPDLAIEVVWTSGGLDKLEIYRGLRVREVWFWTRRGLELHVLRSGRYERVERSELLPDLDLALLVSFLGETSQTRAVRRYREALRAAGG